MPSRPSRRRFPTRTAATRCCRERKARPPTIRGTPRKPATRRRSIGDKAAAHCHGFRARLSFAVAMKIHEYQARQILSESGVPVPPAEVVRSADEAAAAFKKFGGQMCVVKAQVYAGGRGKAGFVKLVHSEAEARDAARFML